MTSGQTFTLSPTAAMMLHELRRHLANEPERPDPDRHLEGQLREVARVHDEWQCGDSAWRLVLGARLVGDLLASSGGAHE